MSLYLVRFRDSHTYIRADEYSVCELGLKFFKGTKPIAWFSEWTAWELQGAWDDKL